MYDPTFRVHVVSKALVVLQGLLDEAVDVLLGLRPGGSEDEGGGRLPGSSPLAPALAFALRLVRGVGGDVVRVVHELDAALGVNQEVVVLSWPFGHT